MASPRRMTSPYPKLVACRTRAARGGRCRGGGHEWIAIRAVAGHGCPTCAGQRVTPATSLAVRVPGVLRFWHPTRNLPLTPAEVSPHSHRRVQWRCAMGPDHEWEGSVDVQARSGGRCPFCSGRRLSVTNCLATCYPRVAAEWHPTKNGTLPRATFFAPSAARCGGAAPRAMSGRRSSPTAPRKGPAAPSAATSRRRTRVGVGDGADAPPPPSRAYPPRRRVDTMEARDGCSIAP